MKVIHFAAGSGRGLADQIESFINEGHVVISLSYTCQYPAFPPHRDEATPDHEEDYMGCERALLVYADTPLRPRWTPPPEEAHIAA